MTDENHAVPGVGTASVAATAFVSSWIGRARPGDLHDPDPVRRAAAWAHWALSSMSPMTGSANRPYLALMLPGAFYDPRGTGPATPPHLEVPAHRFERPDPSFPDRLSQAGNGLGFPWWLVPETLAVKRAVFSVPGTDAGELVDRLNDRRVGLRDALVTLSSRAQDAWGEVEERLAAAPEEMSGLAADDFSADEVAAYWSPAADLGLRVEFDRKLRDSQGKWVSRRVGVWRLVGAGDNGEFVLGTLTPRLTRSSMFTDPLFDPLGESPAALLVRALIMRRILARFTADAGAPVGPEPRPAMTPAPGLRAVVARVGEKLPEASVAAAVKFLKAYPDADDAWTALETWTRGTGTGPRAALTVSRDGFTSAHRAAWRAVRRAEEPDRDDINVVLPLAWDASMRVVRLTYAPRDHH